MILYRELCLEEVNRLLFSKKAECYEMLAKSEWRVDDKGYCFYR